jgi:hypothetical protein
MKRMNLILTLGGRFILRVCDPHRFSGDALKSYLTRLQTLRYGMTLPVLEPIPAVDGF